MLGKMMQSSWSWSKISENKTMKQSISIRKTFNYNRKSKTQVSKLSHLFSILYLEIVSLKNSSLCPGYLINAYEEKDLWEVESNSSISISLRRWKTTDSIYFVFSQYSRVRPYSCAYGIEVSIVLLR